MCRPSTRALRRVAGVVTDSSLLFAVGLFLFCACPAQPAAAAIVTSGDVQPADPATWTTSTTAYVGKTGDGTLTVESGSSLRSAYCCLGDSSGVTGQATVTGTGSKWTSYDLVVGSSGTGRLTIGAAGSLSTNWSLLGDAPDSLGTVMVTGAKSTWTSSDLIVGSSGNGMIGVGAGGSLTSSWSLIGDSPGSIGMVTVTGAGSRWTNTGSSLYVGSSGIGSLTVAAGGLLSTNAEANYIGMCSGSTGEVTVTGAGSKWTNNFGSLYVGFSGSGALRIADGGVATTMYGENIIGYFSSGTVTVTGAGSKWNRYYGTLYVGHSGSGTLAIADGGSVSVINGGCYVAYSPGSVGAVTVAGTGSTWTSGSLSVGYRGTGTLRIAEGGSVSSGDGSIGVSSDGVVTGAGSNWTASPRLSVSGTLMISDGGAVSSSEGSIGGQVTVAGAGSMWTNSKDLDVGGRSGGTLNIVDGALVTVAKNTYVGRENGASGGVCLDGGTLETGSLVSGVSALTGTGTIRTKGLITDVDLVFDSVDDLTQRFVPDTQPGQNITVHLNVDGLGDLGAAYAGTGSLTIRNGMEVSSTRGYVGYKSGSTGVVTVTGAGSTWTNSSTLDVGYSGNGTLTIADGGSVGSAGGAIGGASKATVTGAGSGWTSSSYLSVGGTLTIADGGSLSNRYGTIYGQATITGASSTWTSSSYLSVEGALAITDGGSVSTAGADRSWIGQYSGHSGTVTVTGAGSRWTNNNDFSVGGSGAATLTIAHGGLVSVAKTLTIDYDADGDSFINMASGGMLALKGDADDSLATFLGLVSGTDAIRYWDDGISDWASIMGATPGEDYSLRYLTDGDLAGYTLLTVGTIPEPGTLVLLAGLPLAALARRAWRRGLRAGLAR